MANGQENPYADLIPGQENPYADLIPGDPKKRVAPLTRLAQGLLGMSKLVVGSGEEPYLGVDYLGREEVDRRPAWARVPGEKVKEAYEWLEERSPRPEFEVPDISSPKELAGSVGRNLSALVAEGIEMAPALVAAEGAVAGLVPKAPLGASRWTRALRNMKHGAGLGEAYAVTSGEAVEDPTALITTPLFFAGLEGAGGLVADAAKATFNAVLPGVRAARLAKSDAAAGRDISKILGEIKPERPPQSRLSPRTHPEDANLGRDIAERGPVREGRPVPEPRAVSPYDDLIPKAPEADLPLIEGTEQFVAKGEPFSYDDGPLSVVGRYDPETKVITIGNVQGGDVGRRRMLAARREIMGRYPDATEVKGFRTSKDGLLEGTERSRSLNAPAEAVGEAGFAVGPGMLRRMRVRPDKVTDLPVHSRAIQEQISGTGNRPRQSLGEMAQNTYFNMVSRSAPFRWLEKDIGRPLKPAESIAAAARMAQGSNRRASAFMEYGPSRLSETGEWIPTGKPGLSQTAELVEGDVAALNRYQVSQRTLELEPRGQRTGVTPENARLEIADAAPEMEQAHRALVEFDQELLNYAADAGLFGPGEVEAMKLLGENYVHLGRAFDVGNLGAGQTKAGLFKRLTPEGSTRLILDPWISRIDRSMRIVAAADRQRVGLRLLDLVERFPEKLKGVAELDTTQRAARQAGKFGERLRAAARSEGIDIPADVAEGLAERLGSKELSVADGTILVNRGGVPTRLRVDPQMYAAMQAVGPRDVGGLVRLLSGVSSTFKGGVTLDPGFVIDNAWRDSFDASLQSTYGFKLGLDSAKGLIESINARWLKKPSELYKQSAAAGIGFSTHRGSGRRAAAALSRELVPAPKGIKSVVRTIQHPLEALQRFTQPFEEAGRFAEFARGKKAGADDIQAFMASQDVTVNFQESGAHAAMQAMNAMTPFLNPGVQSLDRAFKAAKNNPKRLLGMGVASITTPTVLLWAANRGDEEIGRMRKSRSGLLNWFIRVPEWVPGVGGEILKLKKPFLYGQVFGTGAEAILDGMAEKDPEALDRWAEGVRDQSGVNMTPQVLQIPLALAKNEVPLFGTPIESLQTQDLPPTHRRTPFTGSTALAVGEETGKIPGIGQFLSPGRIEFLVGQITGTLGSRLLDVSDFIIDEVKAGQPGATSKPTRELAEIPGMSRFVQRQATTSVEPVQAFYSEFHRLGELSRGFKDDVKNNPTRARETLERRTQDLALFKLYDGINKQISAMRQAIIRLEKVPDAILSRDDKLERKKQYTAAIIAYAEQAREAADKFREPNR